MTYSAEQLPTTNIEALATALQRELQRISAEFELGVATRIDRFLPAAPTKLREGMIVGADGTNWNPGAGKGAYVYYTGAWHFLG
jgi:hypothetical protein